jgi:hypothetical protein
MKYQSIMDSDPVSGGHNVALGYYPEIKKTQTTETRHKIIRRENYVW